MRKGWVEVLSLPITFLLACNLKKKREKKRKKKREEKEKKVLKMELFSCRVATSVMTHPETMSRATCGPSPGLQTQGSSEPRLGRAGSVGAGPEPQGAQRPPGRLVCLPEFLQLREGQQALQQQGAHVAEFHLGQAEKGQARSRGLQAGQPQGSSLT